MWKAILSGGWSLVARLGAVVAVVSAIWGHGYVQGLKHDEARDAKATAAFTENNFKVLRVYHEKVKVIYRKSPNVLPNLERLCNGELRDPGGTAGTPEPKAEHGATVAGVAAEITDCLAETNRYNALIQVVRPQVK